MCPIKKNSMPRINSLLDFRKIYDRYFNCLVIYSSGMGIPYQQAKDIVQECVIKLWENCSSVSNITSWLFTSVRNSSINWLKASKKSSGNVKLEEISHIHQHTAEDAIEYFHKVEDAYQKLQQLGGRCKDIFIIFVIEGGSVMLIGEAVKLRILELCAQRELSINKLCTISGITQSTVNNIVSGRNNSVTVSTIKKLCDGLDITIQDFFDSELFNGLEQELQ